MNLIALKTLIRIDQVHSFSKAAQLENITLSALSMQMKALENELGSALFDRTFRPPKLTPIGKQIAAQSVQVLAAQKQLVSICETSDALAGLFQLGFIQSASVRIMPKFLKIARRDHPKAVFELSSALSEHLIEKVRLGVLDAAVVTRTSTVATDLHFSTLGTEEMAFAVPSTFEAHPLETLHLKLPFIHFRPTSGIGHVIDNAMRRLSSKPRQIIVLDSLEACVECVKEGLGFTLLPLPDIERCRDARVHIHSTGPDAMLRELALVTRDSSQHAAWVKAVAEVLQSAIHDRNAP